MSYRARLAITTAEVFNTFCYGDGNSNLTVSETQTAGIPSAVLAQQPPDRLDYGKIRRQGIRNVLAMTWRLCGVIRATRCWMIWV
jgi:hypothetical protein